jgi:hypothetical protein
MTVAIQPHRKAGNAAIKRRHVLDRLLDVIVRSEGRFCDTSHCDPDPNIEGSRRRIASGQA